MPNAGVKSKKLKDSKNNSTLPKQKGANSSNILEEFGSLSKAMSIIENVKFKMGLKELLKDWVLPEKKEELLVGIVELAEQVGKEVETTIQPFKNFTEYIEKRLGKQKVAQLAQIINNESQKINKEIQELHKKVESGIVTEEEIGKFQDGVKGSVESSCKGIQNYETQESEQLKKDIQSVHDRFHWLENENAVLTEENNKIKVELEEKNKKTY